MAIRRGSIPADRFTIISNDWLRDPRISWKAKGLLAYIASHAPGHVLSTDQIIAEGDDGRDAVRAGLAELERAGYLTRHVIRDEKGRTVATDYEIGDPSGLSGAGKAGPGSDQAKQGVSAAQPSDGFTGAGESPPKKTPSQKTKNTPSASPRGTRLPKDWEPSDEVLSWCKTLIPGGRWSEPSRRFVRAEHEKFADYWAAAPGSKGVKLDWAATWRNWMRRAFERFDGARPTSGAPAGQYKSAQVQNAELADRKKLRAQITQAYIEQGMTPKEAFERAGEDLARQAAGETVETSSPMAYIEGVIIDGSQQEVTSA